MTVTVTQSFPLSSRINPNDPIRFRTFLPNVRWQPVDSTTGFLIVRNSWGTALAYKIRRNVGGSDTGDLGGTWPYERIVGVSEVPSIDADPVTSFTYVYGDDIGAWDHTIQRSSGINKNAFSYHGNGLSPVVTSSILIDGVPITFEVAQLGSSAGLRHTSTVTFSDATTANDTFALDFNMSGFTDNVSINSTAAVGAETYPHMWIGGTQFTQAIVNGATTDISTNADYNFNNAGDVSLRDPSTGRTMQVISNAPLVAGYTKTFVRRQTVGPAQRSKIYFNKGSSSGAALGTMSVSRNVIISGPK